MSLHFHIDRRLLCRLDSSALGRRVFKRLSLHDNWSCKLIAHHCSTEIWWIGGNDEIRRRPRCGWNSGATFSKVPRKILGKLLILGATDTQVATSSRGYSATVEHCTNRPINSVQRSNRKLCSSRPSSSSSSKIGSFPKIFLGTFENAAPDLDAVDAELSGNVNNSLHEVSSKTAFDVELTTTGRPLDVDPWHLITAQMKHMQWLHVLMETSDKHNITLSLTCRARCNISRTYDSSKLIGD